jgi:CheY-like chemotaxis protein
MAIRDTPTADRTRPEKALMDGQILVVDDDADIREGLRQALEFEGYSVSQAANGKQAWELLHSRPPPALVLLDLMMPVMDGSELLRLIRSDPAVRKLPVVLVTAFGSAAAARAVESQGCLAKPIDLDELMALVERYCARMSS